MKVNLNLYNTNRFNFKSNKQDKAEQGQNAVNTPIHISRLLETSFDDKKTTTTIYSLPISKFDKLPSSILKKLEYNNVFDPTNEIYLVGGLDKKNRQYLIANSFGQDKYTGEETIAIMYLLSDDSSLTMPQKKLLRIYSDIDNLKLFQKDSNYNPIMDYQKTLSQDRNFYSKLTDLANSSRNLNLDDATNYFGEIKPIIYEARNDENSSANNVIYRVFNITKPTV